MSLPFRQVDVFSEVPTGGNPVAVVHDADGLTDDQMAAFARWTNLSETTFLLAPTEAGRAGGADYRVRIWTPGGELPFAGHPTLGTAHAWLEAGGEPAGPGVVQECGVGLVRLRRDAVGEGHRLAFAAPPLRRSGSVDDADLAQIVRALRLEASDVVRSAWIDNGPGWVAVQLRDADAVLALDPDLVAIGDLKLGVVGEHGPAGAGAAGPGADVPAVEVRAFVPSIGVGEDPVTGSLNAGLGQWLAGDVLPSSYVASQGTVLGRTGRVHVEKMPDGEVWVGGDTRTTVVGAVTL
ncbi:PhzF family phenazine biosynthesis protein [Promicromonospora iranensis]|uniref:PhzF family phenazine biosynthesis protein n=1 Tax=Promicromonospora iranensis TaxID=1105144 RepID=A0ABU2CSN6_9MICO|nr:PhzF family phenazine biosynthesis protein [Promicromonospora iranensis]MDR7384353.1 PhzF family phenazine biosynthesis protein [Promicromonospora iranensis]